MLNFSIWSELERWNGGFEAVNATALCCCDSNSLTSEKKHGRVSKAPRGKKSPWPPPPLHTHCQILINRRLPSFIDESVYIKIQVPPVRRGSHPGSGSWLRSGLGDKAFGQLEEIYCPRYWYSATTPAAIHLLSLGLWTHWPCRLQKR